MPNHISIAPLNETAILVSFGNAIDEALNDKVISLANTITKKAFTGFIECVPAYSSLAVFYDVAKVRSTCAEYHTAYDFVHHYLQTIIASQKESDVYRNARLVEIPVLYDGEDLHYISDFHKQSIDEIVCLHSSMLYTVFMIGFLPGFAYMGTVDDRIETPRKTVPRKRVPAGSVGIAGKQTGIYPQASPGGWQLLGRTPLKLFDKSKSNPCLLNSGDKIRFVAITKDQFILLDEY